MDTIKVVPAMIYTETTPNPNTLKFVVNRPLMPNDFVEIQNIDEAKNAPIAIELFQFPNVVAIYMSNNFISITKDDKLEWFELMPEIKQFLKKYLDEDKPLLLPEFVKPSKTASNQIADNDTDVDIRIKTALDKYVKPAVEMDGGNISFVSFQDGKLTLQLQGSCSGCPSSTITLKQGIENIMKRFVPEVQEVVAEN
ncbi:MAG: NifU family protein [Sphingobacteriales bacterium]|jgi:Fe-S cluster biogenesis protein NfuA|nr:MAG: NifU family protein [Sphingobacteriales bacterium]